MEKEVVLYSCKFSFWVVFIINSTIMKTYIYILQHPITNDVRYVGKSINPKRRYYSHLCNKDKIKTHIYNWIKSLKNNNLKPIMTVIDETENNWQELEKYWIEQFKQWGFNLCNTSNGGDGFSGESAYWNNREVSIYTKNGDHVRTFKSQKECAMFLNTTQGNVKQAVVRRNNLLKKYQIRYGNDVNCIGISINRKPYTWKNKPENHWISKPIKCIEDNLTFNSLTEASKHYNILITSISNILNGITKKTKNGKSFCRL
jgi:hypothetical protein